MSAEQPRDPLGFDYGIGFKSSADRIVGERARRLENARRQLPYGIPFLDDALRSIMPHDFVVVGAHTGVGKTELARAIAASNARNGKRVRLFALEAEEDEIERRTKYAVLAGMAAQRRFSCNGRVFNYPDWYRGEFEAAIGALDAEADRLVQERYRTLHTYYRGPRFGAEDIKRILQAEQSNTDLFVLDHLHYVDNDDDNENRGMRDIVMTIRNTALLVAVPVILVVHLRKRQVGSKELVPTAGDIHGSSDIGKVCTHMIMLEHAFCEPSANKNLNNTFFSVEKDRGDGKKHLIALCPFDWRSKTYADYYTLGRGAKGAFEPLGTSEVPYWAKRHEPMSRPVAGYGGEG